MKCPKCSKENRCPCEACVKRESPGVVHWVSDGDYMSCGHCGHRMHHGDWIELDWEESRALREKGDL